MTGQNIITERWMMSLSLGRNASRVAFIPFCASLSVFFLNRWKAVNFIHVEPIRLSLSLCFHRYSFRDELRVHHVCVPRNVFAYTGGGTSHEINAIVRHRPGVLFVASRRYVGSMSVWNIRAIRLRDIRLIIHGRRTGEKKDRTTRVLVALRFIHASKHRPT